VTSDDIGHEVGEGVRRVVLVEGPTSWAPTGSPPRVLPTGADTAGRPGTAAWDTQKTCASWGRSPLGVLIVRSGKGRVS